MFRNEITTGYQEVRSPNWVYFSSSPRLTEYRAITYWREALHSASRKWGFMYPSARLKPISPVVSLKDIEPAPCPLVFVSSSRARGAHAGEVGVRAALRLRQEIIFQQTHSHRSHADLFDFDGSDNSLPEHECIELPYRIGVFYPVISPLLCASLCFFNGFCWSGAPHGWSSSLYSGCWPGQLV